MSDQEFNILHRLSRFETKFMATVPFELTVEELMASVSVPTLLENGQEKVWPPTSLGYFKLPSEQLFWVRRPEKVFPPFSVLHPLGITADHPHYQYICGWVERARDVSLELTKFTRLVTAWRKEFPSPSKQCMSWPAMAQVLGISSPIRYGKEAQNRWGRKLRESMSLDDLEFASTMLAKGIMLPDTAVPMAWVGDSFYAMTGGYGQYAAEIGSFLTDRELVTSALKLKEVLDNAKA